jgi:hypothetical protein
VKNSTVSKSAKVVLAPKADSSQTSRHVRDVPIGDIAVFHARSAISIELRMVSASSDNVADETLRLFSDPRDEA